MKTFLNIIWHISFLGFLHAIIYAIIGGLFCITIVGMPIGLRLLQFSKFLLRPFGNKMVSSSEIHKLKNTEQNQLWKIFSLIVRILYFPIGLLAAIGCLITIIIDFITLIGILSGIVWANSLRTIFNIVNKVCVPQVVADKIEQENNNAILERSTPI